MDCREFQEKIMPFIQEKLSDEQMELFLNHVEECSECREELEISYSIFWGLRMLQDDTVDSFHIQKSLNQFLKKTRTHLEKRKHRRRFFFGLIVGFILCAIAFFGLHMVYLLHPEWLSIK